MSTSTIGRLRRCLQCGARHLHGDQRRAAAQAADDDIGARPPLPPAPRTAGYGRRAAARRHLGPRRVGVGDEEPRQPGRPQRRRDQLAHLAGADQQRLRSGPRSPWTPSRQIDRRGDDRDRPLADRRLGPHPLGGGEGRTACTASSALPVSPAAREARQLSLTCARTCGSPMTVLSSEAATQKMWRSAASPVST